jgi:hypothetical protein
LVISRRARRNPVTCVIAGRQTARRGIRAAINFALITWYGARNPALVLDEPTIGPTTKDKAQAFRLGLVDKPKVGSVKDSQAD